MFLLTEKQIDRTDLWPPLAIVAPMLFYVQIKLLLLHGFLLGVFSLCALFTLGVCGFLGYRKWRTESGLWIVAALLLCSLVPTHAAFLYLQYVAEIKPLLLGQRPVFGTWKGLLGAADIAIAIGLLQYQVRLCITVLIENWRRTRQIPFRVW